jgi:hypothetical protein
MGTPLRAGVATLLPFLPKQRITADVPGSPNAAARALQRIDP